MANPRQRRKLRSGSHKPVQHSRRAKKLLKKQPPIRGPKVLQEAWDPRKTVRQNYEALGLVATLNPIASGGTERAASMRACAEMEEGLEKPEASSSTSTKRTNGMPKGYGKIIRDADGNIVEVQLGDEDEEEGGGVTQGVGGMEDEVRDPGKDAELAGWVGLGSDRRKVGAENGTEKEDTRVVQALELLSDARAAARRVPRFASKGEQTILRQLVAAHGEDIEAMARDRRLNVDQRTAGELRRAVGKAGGFARLGLKAAAG